MSDQEEIASLKEQLTEAHNEIEQLNAEFEAEKENVTRSEAAMQQLQANFESAMEAYRQGHLEVEAIRVFDFGVFFRLIFRLNLRNGKRKLTICNRNFF